MQKPFFSSKSMTIREGIPGSKNLHKGIVMPCDFFDSCYNLSKDWIPFQWKATSAALSKDWIPFQGKATSAKCSEFYTADTPHTQNLKCFNKNVF